MRTNSKLSERCSKKETAEHLFRVQKLKNIHTSYYEIKNILPVGFHSFLTLSLQLKITSAAIICILIGMQTVWTLIRLLHEEQSYHGPHYLVHELQKYNKQTEKKDNFSHF